ncbi:hypothetical protein [Alteromonas sp. KUL106]|jgi:hypothetical protein|uniref:hypothetical protein n=1 Tax=Alteromonas sp. KUL106 TaxID=2480799 RepID=UPI0012E5E096|nr:hypothetical protein [Alteromonas sp. KUL106]GFD69895.1 hypothetical protein KUL106_31580 [Alteromonas sp. KUL106]GFD80655.1 hypothetical protein KUL118_35170 [Tenacibaculum sp. KUL118]
MLKRIAASCALVFVNTPVDAFEFSFKGMIKPEVIMSNGGVASYGSAYSHVAPTNALRTDVFGGAPSTEQETNYLESESTSFQAAQSRFSLNMKHDNIRAVLEFDFIDGEDGFTNQTAIQAQEPRLRLATLYYDYSDNLTLFGGQKWSTAAGIKSSGSYNWIGNAFRAGNTGFLAMEVGATYKIDDVTITGALTGKGRNATANGINANELGSMPGLAIDVNYKFSGHTVGFAGHFATLNYEDEPGFAGGENQDANLMKVYTTLNFGDVSFNAEYYSGEALNNQNALGIAPAARLSGGQIRESFSESGFFTFVNWKMGPKQNIRVGYASASVDSDDRGRLSLTELNKNTTAYINYGYAVTSSLTAFAEYTHFDTEYGVDFESFNASVGRAGVVFKF